jgi:hypothetical protein
MTPSRRFKLPVSTLAYDDPATVINDEIVLEASESHSDPEKGDSTKVALRNEGMYNPDKGDSTMQIPDNIDREVSENSTEAPLV